MASSRVLVADSNVSTPANAAAAITALMNFNITAPRSLTTYANIAGARCSCPNTLATIGGNGCSGSVTPVHRSQWNPRVVLFDQ